MRLQKTFFTGGPVTADDVDNPWATSVHSDVYIELYSRNRPWWDAVIRVGQKQRGILNSRWPRSPRSNDTFWCLFPQYHWIHESFDQENIFEPQTTVRGPIHLSRWWLSSQDELNYYQWKQNSSGWKCDFRHHVWYLALNDLMSLKFLSK